MVAYGLRNFDNDDVMDWLGEFAQEPSVADLKEALSSVAGLDAEKYLELPECGAAMAAAEVVAAMRGEPAAGLPAEVSQWVRWRKETPSASLVTLALKAVSRVSTSSEMQELCQETDWEAQWQSEVKNLVTRLGRTTD